MKLIYIYHSGFALVGENFTVIIDYYKDSASQLLTGVVHDELLERPENCTCCPLILMLITLTRRCWSGR